MKIIITENKSNEVFSKVLEKRGIKYDILYKNSNGIDSVTGTVYLYKDGQPLGYKHGYEFNFDYDSRFGSLTYEYHYPHLENYIEFFPYLPSEIIINFFSNKVKEYLKDYINKGYSELPIKK
jgi:hypothetical protein